MGSLLADVSVSPSQDVFFRTSLKESVYTWNSGYPKEASESNTEFAGNHRAGMFTLQKYSVENLNAATKLVLTLTGKSGTDALALWTFTNDWSKSTDVATLAATVNTTVGLDLNTTGTPSNSPLINGVTTRKEKIDTENTQCDFTFSGTALAAIKEAADYDGSTGTFTLLITNKLSDMASAGSGDRKFYSSGYTTASYQPAMTASFPVVLNTATGVTYDNLNDAVGALAEDGNTLLIFSDVNVSNRVNFNYDVTITNAAGYDVVLNHKSNANMMFLAAAAKTVTVKSNESGSLTIDGNSGDYSTSPSIFEVSHGGTVYLEGIEFRNISSKQNGAVARVQYSGGSGSLYVKDCTFENISTTEYGVLYDNQRNLFLAGNNVFNNCCSNVYLAGSGEWSGTKYQEVKVYGELTNTVPIVIEAANPAENLIVAYGSGYTTQYTAIDKFVVANQGYRLVKANNDWKMVAAPTVTLSADCPWASFCVDYDALIPEGVKAYVASSQDGSVVRFTNISANTANIPAETGVVLFAPELATETIFTLQTASSAETVGTNILIGTTAATSVSGISGDIYTISKSQSIANGALTFARYTGSADIPANKAYFVGSNGVGEYRFNFAEDLDTFTSVGEVTSLKQVEETANMPKVIYNLAGQRVESYSHPGIYVVNGRKVIVK